MELTVEVIGMKAFKGTIQGEFINSGKVFSRIKFNERNNRAGENFSKGEALEEWRLPDADSVFALQHLSTPFTARLEIERVSNGKETKEIVTSITPVESSSLLAKHKAAEVRPAP